MLGCYDQPAVLLRFQLTATLKAALLERRGGDKQQQSIVGDGVDSVALEKMKGGEKAPPAGQCVCVTLRKLPGSEALPSNQSESVWLLFY